MKRYLTISLYLVFAAVAAAQVKVYTYPSGKDSIEVMHDYRVSICAVADALAVKLTPLLFQVVFSPIA